MMVFKRILVRLGLACVLALAAVAPARADLAAVTLTSYGDYTNGGWTLGFEFSPTANNYVTSLGSFFPGGATDTHGVTIWNTSGTVLATTTVTGNGTEGFDYTAITPLLLLAGTDYVIGATTLSDDYADESTTYTVASGINYIGHVETQTAGVTPIFPGTNAGTYSDFGANFKFTPATAATPEPASLTMLGLGAVSLVGYGWRRKRKAAAATV